MKNDLINKMPSLDTTQILTADMMSEIESGEVKKCSTACTQACLPGPKNGGVEGEIVVKD